MRTGVLGVVVVSVVFVLLGLAIRGPLDSTVGRWDADVGRWFVGQRTGAGNFWSAVGTWLAETPVVAALAVTAALALASRRRWHEFALVVAGMLVEISTYLVVVVAVDRPRPPHGLEHRFTGSFPSGHVAAAIVLYGLLAFVLARRVRSTAVRAALFAVPVLVPVYVATSRVYRGMHHLSDVVAGALIGCCVLLVAARVARHVPEETET